MFSRSHSLYLQKDYQEALALLSSGEQPQQISESSDHSNLNLVLYFNNLGCINFKLKKFKLAAFYFSKAVNRLTLLMNDKKQNKNARSSGITQNPSVRQENEKCSLFTVDIFH
jgi:hypothetical protein